MISFVRLTADDSQLLSNIGGMTLLESHGHSAPGQVMEEYVNRCFSEEACRQELIDEENVFYSISYNGQAAGYYKIILDTSHPMVSMKPVTKLERLYLLKEYYDLKLGHQLLQHAVELSKAQGEKGMWLDVWKKNDRAIRFYEKQGFKPVGESQFVLTATHVNPTWIMLKQF